MIFVAIFACVLLTETFAATVMPTTHAHGHHHSKGTHAHHSHGTRPTHEPSETEAFFFKYDPISHKMLIYQRKKCYLYTMTDMERTDVHSVHGLRSLEGIWFILPVWDDIHPSHRLSRIRMTNIKKIKLIQMVDDHPMGMGTMAVPDLQTMSKTLGHACAHAPTVYTLG